VRQLGGPGGQGLERDADPREDDAADVFAAGGNAIEGDRRAEVDDDQVAPELLPGGDAVDKPVAPTSPGLSVRMVIRSPTVAAETVSGD